MKTVVKLIVWMYVILPLSVFAQLRSVEIEERKEENKLSVSYSVEREDQREGVKLSLTTYDKNGERKSYQKTYENKRQLMSDKQLRKFVKENDMKRSMLFGRKLCAWREANKKHNFAAKKRRHTWGRTKKRAWHHRGATAAHPHPFGFVAYEHKDLHITDKDSLGRWKKFRKERQKHARMSEALGSMRPFGTHMKKVTAEVLSSDSPLLSVFKKQARYEKAVTELRHTPNPNYGGLEISCKSQQGVPIRLEISNLSSDFSKEITEKSTQERYRHMLNVQNWAPDLYLLHIQQGDQESFLQLIVN